MPPFQDSSEKIFHHVDKVHSSQWCNREKLPKILTLRDHIKSAPHASNYLMESQPGVNEMSEFIVSIS